MNRPVIISSIFLTLLLAGVGFTLFPAVSGMAFPASQKVREIPPISGVQSVIVIPVRFKDVENTMTLTALEEKVFTDLNAYFQNASYGRVALTGEVAPDWYQLTRGEKWYGSGRERWETLVYDSLAAADRDVNYREYDFALIVHSGDDQDRTLQEDQVTSFGTYLRARFQTRDGITVLGVSCLSEFDPIGPYAHYLALNMGLPSLYLGGGAVGEWGLMAHGFWAENGSTPVHPLAYSKIRAGWLGDPDLVQVEDGGSLEVSLHPLGSQASGVKAIKLPLSQKQYILLEARRKMGYDSHLPDEGVLLTSVDEEKETGEGVVRVVDGAPETETIDDAPLKVGDIYHNETVPLTVRVEGFDGEAYTVTVDRGGGEPQGILQVDTGITTIPLLIDNTTYTADPEGVVEADVPLGEHTVKAPSLYDHGNGTRSVLEGWADGDFGETRRIEVDGRVRLEAEYTLQYHLSVRSDYGGVDGDGWYTPGETAVLEANPLLEGGNGTRRVFKGWSGVAESSDPRLEVRVDGPGEAYANWETQHQAVFLLDGVPEGDQVTLTVNGVESNLTQGETYKTWVPEGAPLEFDVNPKSLRGPLEKTVFQGFLDLKGENLTSPLTVEEPQEIVVQYSKSRVTYIPDKEQVEKTPEKAQGLYRELRSRLEAAASRNPTSLYAYLILASPAVWAASTGAAVYEALPLPAPASTAVSVTIIAVLLGLIYAFPPAILAAFLGWRRRNWRPRLKTLIPLLLLLALGVGLVVADGVWLSAASFWGWLGLVITGVAASLLASLGLAIALARNLFKKDMSITRLIPGGGKWK